MRFYYLLESLMHAIYILNELVISDNPFRASGRWTEEAGMRALLSVLQAITMIINGDYVVHKKTRRLLWVARTDEPFLNSEFWPLKRQSTHLLMVIACSTLHGTL